MTATQPHRNAFSVLCCLQGMKVDSIRLKLNLLIFVWLLQGPQGAVPAPSASTVAGPTTALPAVPQTPIAFLFPGQGSQAIGMLQVIWPSAASAFSYMQLQYHAYSLTKAYIHHKGVGCQIDASFRIEYEHPDRNENSGLHVT